MTEENTAQAPAAPATPAPAPAAQQAEVPSITAGDLKMMVNIIDAGSQRGAWRGEELSVIGTLRTKLATVVEAVAPQVDESAEKTEEGKATNAA